MRSNRYIECLLYSVKIRNKYGNKKSIYLLQSITYWLMTPRDKSEVEYYLVLSRDEQAVDFKFISKEWADFLLEKWR
jgi:hypothetical protein